MMFTPALKISCAVAGVMPEPPAAFSPFATTMSTFKSRRKRGTNSFTARRPGSPTMSPMNRIFTASRYCRGSCWQLEKGDHLFVIAPKDIDAGLCLYTHVGVRIVRHLKIGATDFNAILIPCNRNGLRLSLCPHDNENFRLFFAIEIRLAPLALDEVRSALRRQFQSRLAAIPKFRTVACVVHFSFFEFIHGFH